MARNYEQRLDRYMRFRCTEQEGERLVRTAKSRSMTFSEYARRELLPSGRPRRARRQGRAEAGTGEEVAAQSEAKMLAFQIQKLGVNLNQIVKAMHTHQAPPPPELRPLLDEIRQYVRRAQRMPKGYEP